MTITEQLKPSLSTPMPGRLGGIMAFLHLSIITAGLYHTFCEGISERVPGGSLPSEPLPAPPCVRRCWARKFQEIPSVFINQLIHPRQGQRVKATF